jgi:hypothetical protein
MLPDSPEDPAAFGAAEPWKGVLINDSPLPYLSRDDVVQRPRRIESRLSWHAISPFSIRRCPRLILSCPASQLRPLLITSPTLFYP